MVLCSQTFKDIRSTHHLTSGTCGQTQLTCPTVICPQTSEGIRFTHHLTSGTCGLTAGLYQRIHPLKILFIQEFKNLLKLARPKLQMTFYTKLPLYVPVLSETVCGLTWYHHGNDLPLLQPLHD